MEQMRGETQHHQQEQQPTPLKCPRCDSLDTKFRYFNNHSLSQPRHYCRTCKRQWTVGGNLRNIPIGGKTRNSRHTKASSSRSSNPRSQPPQPPLPVGDHHSQNSQQSPLMAGMVPQIFDTAMIQPPPMTSSYFNDEISCLDAIQSLIQPDLINQHVNAGNFGWGSGSQNMEILEEWNFQSMASQRAVPQQIPRQIEAYQAQNQANYVSSSQFNDSLAQSTWTINSMPQDVSNNFSFSTSNAGFWNNWNNTSGNMTDTEMDATSVNVDEWLNFPGYGPQ